ncbi:hypothetical protein ACYZT7_23195 [Pseudomonas sp. RT4P38]
MTTGPKDYAERAASAFNRRDVEAMLAAHCAAHFTFRDGLAIREEAFFDSAVLMPLAYPAEG